MWAHGQPEPVDELFVVIVYQFTKKLSPQSFLIQEVILPQACQIADATTREQCVKFNVESKENPAGGHGWMFLYN